MQKSQASPGGQSSCSSERSPLGSTNNNDSGVEMNANTGGSFEDLSNLDDIPSVESIGTAGASALRKLENLRIDKLNQMRKTPSSGKCVKLPAIHNTGKYIYYRKLQTVQAKWFVSNINCSECKLSQTIMSKT